MTEREQREKFEQWCEESGQFIDDGTMSPIDRAFIAHLSRI